jgi:hypothetical protein
MVINFLTSFVLDLHEDLAFFAFFSIWAGSFILIGCETVLDYIDFFKLCFVIILFKFFSVFVLIAIS